MFPCAHCSGCAIFTRTMHVVHFGNVFRKPLHAVLEVFRFARGGAPEMMLKLLYARQRWYYFLSVPTLPLLSTQF